MRPRHKAAENSDRPAHRTHIEGASMRPRHKAAENITREVDMDSNEWLQ